MGEYGEKHLSIHESMRLLGIPVKKEKKTKKKIKIKRKRK